MLKNNKRKIILDTDFIIDCVNWKIHFKEEFKKICDFNFKLFILDKTLDELENKKNKDLVKKIIEKENVDIINTNSSKNVDDLLLEQKESIIATQDKELKERLKKRKMSFVTIRQKKYLMIQNVL